MSFISYAQNLEDVMLYRALKHIDQGFYIDVGAWDPVEDSVTKAFYERGWQGINIEPVQEYYNRLVEDRPRDINLMVAVSDHNGLTTIYEIVGTGLSTLDENIAKFHARAGRQVRERKISCLTLTEICRACDVKEIHFLKVDAEGAEGAVLAGLDFSVFRPWIIVVEAIDPILMNPSFERWEPLLLTNGYLYVFFDGINRFYLAKEKFAELKAAFDAPPNIRDNFIRYRELQLQKERDALQDKLERLREEHEACLRESSEALATLNKENEELRRQTQALQKERDALHSQIRELQTWLNAVYTSTSWRITAPLRLIKGTIARAARSAKRRGRKITCSLGQLARKFVTGLVRSAAKKPWLYSLGKKLLSKNPRLKACVRQMLKPELAPRVMPMPLERRTQEDNLSNLPESAQKVYWELKVAIQRALAERQV